jgi:hypothetical protein
MKMLVHACVHRVQALDLFSKYVERVGWCDIVECMQACHWLSTRITVEHDAANIKEKHCFVMLLGTRNRRVLYLP